MNPDKIKVIAMDLDGTLTQHKQPMTPDRKPKIDVERFRSLNRNPV